MFYIYILYSKRLDKFYVGSTNNIERRLEDHNRGKTAFTKQGMPWKIKYSETFNIRAEAVHREQYIKKQKSRIFIEKLIHNGA